MVVMIAVDRNARKLVDPIPKNFSNECGGLTKISPVATAKEPGNKKLAVGSQQSFVEERSFFTTHRRLKGLR